MPEQLRFDQCTIQQVVSNYHAAPLSESKTDGAQVRLTPTQKEAVVSICKRNGIGVSTFISSALDCYIDLFDLREKIVKHRQLIRVILEQLS